MSLHVGVYDHFGWAVAVTASDNQDVVDRRKLDLLEASMPNASIHHSGPDRSIEEVKALISRVRASARRVNDASLDALGSAPSAPITSLRLRALPVDFPSDIAVQLRPPYEARADAIMYRQVLAEAAVERGWEIQYYDAKTVEAEACPGYTGRPAQNHSVFR